LIAYSNVPLVMRAAVTRDSVPSRTPSSGAAGMRQSYTAPKNVWPST